MPQHISMKPTDATYTVTTHGVPIGVIALPADADRVTVALDPLPAYSALQPMVRRASSALADVARGRAANAIALHEAATLGRLLELRDAAGALVPVDFIELTEWPGGNIEFAAFVRFRQSPALRPATVRPQPRGDSDFSAPAA